ncbi:hypothetical protein D16iCDA_18150 [Pseudomonas seleniipraecipitans]|uniref:Uncharacterized protein n=1 Tax=Phytopseudomonas seleniipraecipitans TaxID=640205 RepID=A0ABY5J9D9_9GAMM|nr:hypothetical protein [Pseudomonas seleniipraecipitans]UUD63579.1 hypothetical protein D16iCDA_18150 [Pseudomonas seleniipraecipitans]
MSYIDTIKHELVGYINGLPIYHPLETVIDGGWGDYDFSCSPQNLVIGGGAGEHPALVVHDLGSLVALYILLCIEKHTEHFTDSFIAPPEETIDRLSDVAFDTKESLEFCGWSMTNIRDFIELAKCPLHFTPLLENQAPEEWIKESIGQFVYFSLPELNPFAEEINSLPGIKDWFPGYWMSNVTCPPPNHIKSKKESLQGSGFKEHGFFRWDYTYPPKV